MTCGPNHPALAGLDASIGAIVFDLDGTLARLTTNWPAADTDTGECLRQAGIDVTGETVWEHFEVADNHGLTDELEAIVADYELEGARDSVRLPLADDLSTLSMPVGVCTLNAGAACRRALERHGLAKDVDAIVARDSLPERKPDPRPLEVAIERLGATPSTALFVGDSERDEATATHAGVAYRYVGDGPSPY